MRFVCIILCITTSTCHNTFIHKITIFSSPFWSKTFNRRNSPQITIHQFSIKGINYINLNTNSSNQATPHITVNHFTSPHLYTQSRASIAHPTQRNSFSPASLHTHIERLLQRMHTHIQRVEAKRRRPRAYISWISPSLKRDAREERESAECISRCRHSQIRWKEVTASEKTWKRGGAKKTKKLKRKLGRAMRESLIKPRGYTHRELLSLSHTLTAMRIIFFLSSQRHRREVRAGKTRTYVYSHMYMSVYTHTCVCSGRGAGFFVSPPLYFPFFSGALCTTHSRAFLIFLSAVRTQTRTHAPARKRGYGNRANFAGRARTEFEKWKWATGV